MARELNFTFENSNFNFTLQKIDRSKIYGYTAIDVRDENNSSCSLASISDDGLHILSKGCVGYISMTQDDQYIANNQLKITNAEGEALERIPSSFDTNIPLQASSLEEFLTLNVKSVYQISATNEDEQQTALIEKLTKHKVLKFLFNYRADYSQDTAFMIHNSEGLFILIGHINPFEFIGLEQQAIEIDDTEDDDDDFDFGML